MARPLTGDELHNELRAAFVFTDLVGSTAMKTRCDGHSTAERNQDFRERVLTPHITKLNQHLTEFEGRIHNNHGDGHLLVFAAAMSAVKWAIRLQESHQDAPILDPDGKPVEAKIGIHWGTAVERDGIVIGSALDMAARIIDLARGGQIFLSKAVAAMVEDEGMRGVGVHSHGKHCLRGIGDKDIYEIAYRDGIVTSPRAAIVVFDVAADLEAERYRFVRDLKDVFRNEIEAHKVEVVEEEVRWKPEKMDQIQEIL